MPEQKQFTQTYDVDVRRDGRWWLVYVPALDTAGQARHLREVEEVAREVIGLYLDVDPGSFDIDVKAHLPQQAQALWDEAENSEAAARAALSQAAKTRRETISTLRGQGISQADIARLLQISKQRVSQLAR